MSNTGGVFSLQTRDGSEDKILTAVEVLNKRLAGIRTAKILMGKDPVPTLTELEETHQFFIKSAYKPYVPVSSEYFKTTPSSPVGFGNQVVFELPTVGDFISDQVVRVVISGFGIEGADPLTANTYRYANFPGLKLFNNVEFSVGNVKIDNYTNIDSLFQSNFMLEGHKKLALARAVGQQEEKFASIYHPEKQISEEIRFTDGAQTLKTYQPQLEFWVPLLFWHNLLPANAISNRLLQWGQRFIKIDLCSLVELITARAPGAVNKIPIPDDIKSQITIKTVELYTNALFIGAEIHDIYFRRLNFGLIRIHGRVRAPINNANGNYLLNAIKHATEFMYVGFRPVANNTPEKWTDMVFLEENSFCVPVVENCNTITIKNATYKNKLLPILSLALISQGIRLFHQTAIQFYEDYLPFSRSNTAVGLRGAFLIPFNLKTGEAQPTGYLNMSRNRETYLQWTSNLISVNNPVELLITAIELNFLIVKDGKAWLLYET